MPENVLKRQRDRAKEEPADLPTEDETDLRRQQILRDLNLALPEAVRAAKPSKTYCDPRSDLAISFDSKKALARALVNGIEDEVERLRRQSETLQMRRERTDHAGKGAAVKSKAATKPGDTVIHVDSGRAQVIRDEHGNRVEVSDLDYESLEAVTVRNFVRFYK